jgi:hypothetical protein
MSATKGNGPGGRSGKTDPSWFAFPRIWRRLVAKDSALARPGLAVLLVLYDRANLRQSLTVEISQGELAQSVGLSKRRLYDILCFLRDQEALTFESDRDSKTRRFTPCRITLLTSVPHTNRGVRKAESASTPLPTETPTSDGNPLPTEKGGAVGNLDGGLNCRVNTRSHGGIHSSSPHWENLSKNAPPPCGETGGAAEPPPVAGCGHSGGKNVSVNRWE